MKVLMIGATGRNAGMVLPALLAHGVTVRALVRSENGAATAREHGAAETVLGDLAEPAGLPAALAGVDGVFHINPAFAPHEAEWGVRLVEAAAAAGVGKFVFSGVIHPSLSAMVNHRAKLPLEEALYTSGLDYTVLQPAMFLQNLDALWPEVVEYGRIALPYSTTAQVCWVDYRDVAEVAARAMVDPALAHGTFELCAAGLLDRVELARIATEVLGRPVTAERVPFQEWAAGLPEGPTRDGLAQMMQHYDAHGFAGGNALVLRTLLGREPRTARDYLGELAAARG